MIKISNLQKRFDDLEVLRDVNIDVAEGEVVCIIGPSGSGKSTLLRCINQLETYDDGEIDYMGKPVNSGQALHELRQRVAIARAMAMNPEVILFDEPTSALDPELVGEVLGVIRKVAAEGVSMVIVTHEMNFAREVADRILFMEDGVIVEDAPPEEFFEHPKNERIRQFIRKVEKR